MAKEENQYKKKKHQEQYRTHLSLHKMLVNYVSYHEMFRSPPFQKTGETDELHDMNYLY